jgi:hypothetical protein
MKVPRNKQTCQHSFFELREDPERPGKQKPFWECHHNNREVRVEYGSAEDGCTSCPEWSPKI